MQDRPSLYCRHSTRLTQQYKIAIHVNVSSAQSFGSVKNRKLIQILLNFKISLGHTLRT